MPASVAHAVFCGDIFFVFQSFRKGGHIHETADQVAVFRHHSGIAELIQLLRGTAVVSGQAVRLIIVGDFLKIVALQINKAKMQFFDGLIYYIRSTAAHRKRQPAPYSSLKLHLAKCSCHPTPYHMPPYFVKALFCPVHHHANSAPLLWAPPSRGGSHRNPTTARSRQAAESPPAPKAQRPRGPPA